MEPQYKTSFIPRKTAVARAKVTPQTRGTGPSFFMLVAVIFFVVTVVFAVGVFGYKLAIRGVLENQLASLERAQQAFEPAFLSQATRLNSRILGAKEILSGHIAPSAVFSLLEENTLQTVSFKNFNFTKNDKNEVAVTAQGEGQSFRSIVLQSDQFGSSGYLKDVLFSGLQPSNDGTVSFSFQAILDPQLIMYDRVLQPLNINEPLNVEQPLLNSGDDVE